MTIDNDTFTNLIPYLNLIKNFAFHKKSILRNYYAKYLRTISDFPWKDTKLVNFVPTFCECLFKQKLQRYDKYENGRVQFEIPTLVKEYF